MHRPGTSQIDLPALVRKAGFSELRAGQEESVRAAIDGRDVLAVMPTGHGKSAIYQLAATALSDRGLTVVVSPLIALQWDQLRQLEELPGAPEGRVINSDLSDADEADAWAAIEGGETGVVFLAPEQLAKDEVFERLERRGVALFVVDEAHCVSSWGHDFRPDYLHLGDVIERLGHPVVVALTATGSAPVRDDVEAVLGLRDPLVLVTGFDRPNLHLAVLRHEQESEKEAAVIEQVVALSADGQGLLYVATRRDTEQLAERLGVAGLRAAPFHGSMAARRKEAVYEAFQAGELDVVVATSAFGMGIDKADIRFVVHAAITESADDYYQEIGRGGRDGDASTIVLHYREEDLGLRRYFTSSKPNREKLTKVVKALRAAKQAPDARTLAEKTGLSTRALRGQLDLLTEAGVAREEGGAVRLVRQLTPAKAYAAAEEVAERRTRIGVSRLEMVRQYAETLDCRRQFLLGYFGQEAPDFCGGCDNCDEGRGRTRAKLTAVPTGEAAEPGGSASGADSDAPNDASVATSDEPWAAGSTVDHERFGSGTVVSVDDDRLTVFFESEGYTVLSKQIVAEQGLLRAS